MSRQPTRRNILAAAGAAAASAALLPRPALAAAPPRPGTALPGCTHKVAAASPAPTPAPTPATTWPFYAFDNGLGTVKSLADKCKLLKDLGYVGLEYHLSGDRWHAELPKMLEQLDKHSLRLCACYTVPPLGGPISKHMPESIKRLKDRPTRIEMGIRRARGSKLKASDPAGDKQGIEMIQRVLDWCGDTGPTVCIYPHTGFWTERVEDGVRLAKQINDKRFGTNFNLVHWSWCKKLKPLPEILKEAEPYLRAVTINGMQGRKILSLDQGDYDILGFMKLVRQVGYTGDVGLQCYSVKGPSGEHLKRSMATWQQVCKAVSAEKA